MDRIRRSRRRAVVSVGTNETGLSFPAALLQPPQSQIARYGDAVADRVAQLDLHAQHLGEGFGISLTSFVLNALPKPAGDDVSSALALLARMMHREERITLERRGGRWGLYFTRAAALLGNDQRVETIPLRDAPLDVRERFLVKSEEFFRAYLDLCKDRLGKMQVAVKGADRTLMLLASVRIE